MGWNIDEDVISASKKEDIVIDTDRFDDLQRIIMKMTGTGEDVMKCLSILQDIEVDFIDLATKRINS